MNKIFFAALCFLAISSAFAFTVRTGNVKQDQQKPVTKGLPHKWFKYRTGEPGVPVPDKNPAKNELNYVLSGDSPYCGGFGSFCGIYAQPSDNTPSASPLITPAEEAEIDVFFQNPTTYTGFLVDRTMD